MDNTHLEIECFVTVEDENKSTQLVAKGFDRLGLSSTSGS